ncbi:proline dehydrogenase family protein [Halalkalibaculum sp. DA3122]|uniref:proline dehydrogenase family protein n=1 Tax=Halalkalibaculum sp. DA3122 TaxID=3373607 RepID=UPI003754349B
MKLPFFLASRFVAGETLDQAIPKVQNLNQKGISVTLDMLGENVTSRTMAREATDGYISLIHGIEEAGLDSTISIKLTMLGLDIGPEFCRDNLFRLLDVARKRDQFVRIDMEGSDYTQATIDIFREAFGNYGSHVGIVIQAYLYRSKQDIDELSAMGADIRLCKGAYKEPAKVALQEMPAIREAFKEYAAKLLDSTPCPRMATHDDQLIEWLLDYTEDQKIDKARFEVQMLYGLRQETMERLAAQGYNTRIYVPYGTMWLPYFKRRLTERKENIWFVLSTIFKS